MLLSCPCGHRHDQALSPNVSNSRKKYKFPPQNVCHHPIISQTLPTVIKGSFLIKEKKKISASSTHKLTVREGNMPSHWPTKGKKEIIVLRRFIYYLCVRVSCLHITDVHRVCLMITVGSRGCLIPLGLNSSCELPCGCCDSKLGLLHSSKCS